jgi:hypothetical protein
MNVMLQMLDGFKLYAFFLIARPSFKSERQKGRGEIGRDHGSALSA